MCQRRVECVPHSEVDGDFEQIMLQDDKTEIIAQREHRLRGGEQATHPVLMAEALPRSCSKLSNC